MIRSVFTAILFTLLLAACQKKAAPVITTRNAEKPSKIVSPYASEGSVKPDTLTGKTVYTSRCGRCHGLPDATLYSKERWENVLLSMLPRAGVDKTDAVHVRAYVLALAAK
ncbi:MAG: hypothetical protein JNM88_04235 [Chitinophagaceae bacterium]|nr:hypothetical protein [Chitinophagaceae bacterium]